MGHQLIGGLRLAAHRPQKNALILVQMLQHQVGAAGGGSAGRRAFPRGAAGLPRPAKPLSGLQRHLLRQRCVCRAGSAVFRQVIFGKDIPGVPCHHGAFPNQPVGRLTHGAVHIAGDRKDIPALRQGKACRNKGAALLLPLHHQRAVRQPGNDAVADGKVIGVGFRSGRKFTDDRAAVLQYFTL